MSLRSRILEDPYYRFKSAFELAVAAELGVRIDVNQSTVDDWLRLPGISIHQARTLVKLSEAGVPFYSLSDVAAALNLPVARLQPLLPVLSFQYYHEDLKLPEVNPNQASFSELVAIPGVDSDLAEAIVCDRNVLGKYTDLVDLQQRLRLPGELVGKLMHYLRFR
jgi:DNA uptake protein ComE-like DNA-binding protein